MSRKYKPFHIWRSHVTYEWVMSQMNESCRICRNDVTNRRRAESSARLPLVLHTNEPYHIWMSHVTYEWVKSHLNDVTNRRCAEYLVRLPLMLHIRRSHVTYEWVMPHMKKSCHTWMSHVKHIKKWCHMRTSHVTYEWVMSRTEGARSIRRACLSCAYHVATALGWQKFSKVSSIVKLCSQLSSNSQNSAP